jgi:hypothetical protein
MPELSQKTMSIIQTCGFVLSRIKEWNPDVYLRLMGNSISDSVIDIYDQFILNNINGYFAGINTKNKQDIDMTMLVFVLGFISGLMNSSGEESISSECVVMGDD